ncbi:uncharacterized protein LOC117181779 isoform X2 [Belonocnema kinseyi]|uniref:uncharacterized protein LOC117181779 isoform X2 n=1 Tax=Belonocnema kinseyi TaxID=2817044 RepID=UPI00143D8EA4|nr:uncharacterized protein LOC117181779 isoform X2 [Belonocnema kinseyi]
MKLSLYFVVLATIFIHAEAAPAVDSDEQENGESSYGTGSGNSAVSGRGSLVIDAQSNSGSGDGSETRSGNFFLDGFLNREGASSSGRVLVRGSTKDSADGEDGGDGIRTVTVDVKGSRVADDGLGIGNLDLKLDIFLLGSNRRRSAFVQEVFPVEGATVV